MLTDAQGGTTVLPLAYTYGPKLLRIVPNTADPQGHSRVTIFAYGIGFFPSSGVSITIGGQPVAMSGAVWNTPTNLNFPEQSVTVPVPPGTPGWADVEVTVPCSGQLTSLTPHLAQFPVIGPARRCPGRRRILRRSLRAIWPCPGRACPPRPIPRPRLLRP